MAVFTDKTCGNPSIFQISLANPVEKYMSLRIPMQCKRPNVHWKATVYWRYWYQQGSNILQRWRLKALEASQTSHERMSCCAVEQTWPSRLWPVHRMFKKHPSGVLFHYNTSDIFPAPRFATWRPLNMQTSEDIRLGSLSLLLESVFTDLMNIHLILGIFA